MTISRLAWSAVPDDLSALDDLFTLDHLSALDDFCAPHHFARPTSSARATTRVGGAGDQDDPVCALLLQSSGARNNRNAHPSRRAPVLLASGGGGDGASALRYAGEQARACAVDLLVVRPWNPALDTSVEHEAAALADLMAAARRFFPDVAVVGRLIQGPAEEVLLVEAAHTQLLVVAVVDPPRPGADLAPLDAALLRHAPCRVALTWRPKEPSTPSRASRLPRGGATSAETRARTRWMQNED